MNRKFKHIFYAFITWALVLISTDCCHDKVPEIIIPTVSTDSVTHLTSTSAICHGTLISTGNGTCDIGFCSSLINPEPSHCSSENLNNISSDNYSFSAATYLTPGMNYFVRAYVSNEVGKAYGNVISFSTPGSITGNINFNPDLTYDSIYDIDGNSYKTIKIGNQTWMAENLKTKKYNDGTDITLTQTTPSHWVSTPSYYWYLNGESKFRNTYGALYNWYCVNTGKLCPTGWHIPSYPEFKTLTIFLGGDSISGAKLKEIGSAHWFESSYARNLGATNNSGFTALPGGNVATVIDFAGIGQECYIWSSTDYSDYAHGLGRVAYTMSIYIYSKACFMNVRELSCGLSVRCVKD